jgi:hypothetical protein
MPVWTRRMVVARRHRSLSDRTVVSLDALPRDRRGLPVPYVAAWSSEHWAVARWDPHLPGRRIALFTAGRLGRGTPCFDVMNEPRQREVVMTGRCQVCTDPIPRDRRTGIPIGFLPSSAIDEETIGRLDGDPVLAEPLCCESCAVYVTENCCVLAKRPAKGIVRVTQWDPVLQFIDPSAAPATHARRFDKNPDMTRLGIIARRHGGLVGMVKVCIREMEQE